MLLLALLALLPVLGVGQPAAQALAAQDELPPLSIPGDDTPPPDLPAPAADEPPGPAEPVQVNPGVEFPPLFVDISGRAGQDEGGAELLTDDASQPLTGSGPADSGSRLANPDSLEASSADVSPDGVVHARGGTLHITSLVEGSELLLTADEIEYDTSTGIAEMWGEVVLNVTGAPLKLQCTHLYYDPLMQRMEAEGIRLELPLSDVLGTAPEVAEPHAALGDHFYMPTPKALYMNAAQARVDFDPYKQQFVLSRVRFCHNPDPEPDLYVTAREARFGADDQLHLFGLGLYISGHKVAGWPHLSRRIPPQPGFYGFQLPHITINHDVGFAVKQGVNVELGVVKAHGLFDYSTNFGNRAFGYIYTEPMPGAELGIAAGERSETNADRINIDRRDDYNLQYRQDFKLDNSLVDQLRVMAEYGRSVVHNEAAPDLQITEQRVRDTRFKTNGSLSFPLVRLSGNLYLTSAALGFYTDYSDAHERYVGLGGEAGVVWRRDGYDNFVMYRSYDVMGEPVFLFDKVREDEIDFGGRVKLQPGWRHVLQGIYDLDRDRFDTLQVGALKRLKTYEIGMYWDFARNNAGLEFGLLVD